MIKITVGIPVHNQEELVIRALESIPKKENIEIIVIDDGSEDGTWDKLIEYRIKYPELVLLYNETNKGVAYTVNRIYDNAQGEYITLLGSDDYFYTDNFEECIKQLDGTDLIYYDIQTNNGNIWKVNEKSKRKICGSVKFMRKDFIGKTRCPEDKVVAEDKVFYQKILRKKPTEKFTHICVKHYNYPREGSLTNLYEKELI